MEDNKKEINAPKKELSVEEMEKVSGGGFLDDVIEDIKHDFEEVKRKAF